MGPLSTRSKIGRDEIKWQELLLHFRSIQTKHERARRQALGTDNSPYADFSDTERPSDLPAAGGQAERTGRPVSVVGRAPLRRRVTGELPLNPTSIPTPGRSGALSPLNPRARAVGGQNGVGPTPLNPGAPPTQKRRPISLTRK